MTPKFCTFCGRELTDVFTSTVLEDLYAFKCKCGSFIVRKFDEGEFNNDRFNVIKEGN